MDIRINKIVNESYVDGPGKRTVIFVQGCTLACPFCQNKALWPAVGGELWDAEKLAKHVAEIAKDNGGNVTLSGGEPLQQARSLALLIKALRRYSIKHIIQYSGYTWDEIIFARAFDNAADAMAASDVLSLIDVLVDGRFVKELDDQFITYRGSRNQLAIDVPASLGKREPVLLNWDNELVITESGNVLMPVGFAPEFADLGTPKKTRLCGQTKEVMKNEV